MRGEGIGLLENGLGCTLPESQQEGGLLVGALARREHPDGEIIRPGAYARGASRLMNGELGTAAGRGDLVRLALRLIVEETLEGEVSDALGRERYERGETAKPAIATVIGRARSRRRRPVGYSAPQVRDTSEPFVSNVRAALSGRTRELERLAVELYARGLWTRDLEDAFTDETGRRLCRGRR